MFGCNEQLISEYIDGDLAPEAARLVEHHLWACPRCRTMFLDLRALLAAIRLVRASGTPMLRSAYDGRDSFGFAAGSWRRTVS